MPLTGLTKPPGFYGGGPFALPLCGLLSVRLLAVGILLAGWAAIAGCTSTRACVDLSPVATELTSRVGPAAFLDVEPGAFVVPPEVEFDDGLSEDEALSTALANNSAFQATLTQLGMAEGDVVQAGLLTNPNFVTFIPLGAKPWEWTLFMPIEAFLLRPYRVEQAEQDYERVAYQLVQTGLTLARDVRVAYTDLGLAEAQEAVAREAAGIRRDVLALTVKRFERGDISELEVVSARVDALNAEANAAWVAQNTVIARNRLAALLGMPAEAAPLRVPELTEPVLPALDTESLIAHAWTARPDVQAAHWSVLAAERRAQLARAAFWRWDFVADSNAQGFRGYEAGPGLRFDVPLFHRNQGGILRAEAELEQAQRNRDVIRDQIVQEIRTAAAQAQQARDNLAVLRDRVLPVLDEALHIAQRGYEDGGAPYFLVLQTTAQYLDARTRVLDQTAALQRAVADLERAIGGRLAAVYGAPAADPGADAPKPSPSGSEP